MKQKSKDLVRKADTTWKRLLPGLESRANQELVMSAPDFEQVFSRLSANFQRLFNIYYELYGGKFDFYFHLEELLYTLFRMWSVRPENLKQLDENRESSDWFHSHEMLGGVCYVDLYAGNLKRIREKIPYFKELGLTYLHLMPLYESPELEDDGGYAVSSYRRVRNDLGTIEQLRELAEELSRSGISLVLDFVFNHTSDEHDWALKALSGDEVCQDYFWMFSDRDQPDAYEKYLREIFPDTKEQGNRTGAFTYNSQLEKWVWTTFHSFQWDLNYSNPEVFNRMVEEMLFLANCGVEILRLDAVAFIWKQLGTDCENLPEAHILVEAFNLCARIAAPALLFKSEAIVHPDEVIRYISSDECQLSYNPNLMALLWESLATRKVELLQNSLKNRFAINSCCSWVNYVRSHDDIGWTFSDQDAAEIGINGFDHRQFLNEFYSGVFPGSFARGLLFQFNPVTRDGRICGTCASLAGVEKALFEETDKEVELALRRILLIYGIVLTIGGIPLIYLGDELGTLNDYSFKDDISKSTDNRWVHRPPFDNKRFQNRLEPDSVEGDLFRRLNSLISFRKENPVFSGNRMTLLSTGNVHVLGYARKNKDQQIIILANFSESSQTVSRKVLKTKLDKNKFLDLLDNEVLPAGEIELDPYRFLCLR